MKSDTDKARAKIKRDVLFGKIETMYNRAEQKVNERIAGKKGRAAKPTDEEQAVLDSYRELMDMASDTSYPLKDVEWLFNNGALRSHDEIVEFNRKKEQEAYREDQFELDEIYYNTRAEHKRVLLQRLCFFIPFALVATGWFCVYIWFFPGEFLSQSASNLRYYREPIKTYLFISPEARSAEYKEKVLRLVEDWKAYDSLTGEERNIIKTYEDRGRKHYSYEPSKVSYIGEERANEILSLYREIESLEYYFGGYPYVKAYPVLQLIFNKHFIWNVIDALRFVRHSDLRWNIWWYRAGFSLLYVVSFIIVLAVNGLSVVVIDYKEYKRQVQRCSKAGVKTPIPTNLIADSAMYGYFLHSMGSMFSSGKRK